MAKEASRLMVPSQEWTGLRAQVGRCPYWIRGFGVLSEESFDEILEEYPQLSVLDIRAALAYAADVIHQDVLVPLPA